MKPPSHPAFPIAKLTPGAKRIGPCGSELRDLATCSRGGLTHCILHPGCVSRAIRHSTADLLWYVVSGRGEVWRRHDGTEQVDFLEPATSVAIPCGTAFQFRVLGEQPLIIVIATLPFEAGAEDSAAAPGPWVPSY